MNNGSIYILTEVADSLVDIKFENMNDWLINLKEDELSKYYTMCNKPPEERTGKEGYEICLHLKIFLLI